MRVTHYGPIVGETRRIAAIVGRKVEYQIVRPPFCRDEMIDTIEFESDEAAQAFAEIWVDEMLIDYIDTVEA